MVTRVFRALLAGLVLFVSPLAHADEEQQNEPAETEEQQNESAEPGEQQNEPLEPEALRLEKEFNDPLTTLPQIFIQNAYTPANYGTDAQTNRVIARAIVPRIPRFSLFPLVQLVRPSVTLVTVPEGRGSATRTELGDTQLFDFAVLPGSGKVRGLYWAAGPVFVFPTATDKTAGQGSWQVGPGVGAIYKGIPGVLLGGLIQNPISFAYTSPERTRSSTLLIQPILLTHLGWGFYLKSADATWAINWQRHSSTTLPLSFGIGYIRNREGFPPINLFVTGEWMAYRQFAPVAPQTTIRFGMTIAMPGWRPWK
jgi:hypothetical protein